ncbi:electron transfer flavoprotein subunit alpha/FixB family protein [Uliginosibacterium sp. H3]|uniref:Electron transfer flavoprotein subunit alpha/FixB family protein n=1 Tax=Uliginosibacterium silvisoli TaxID=3114758 RepID=A0ABU6K6P1_9RHOO|nr:electron transfer flavoprotein subunit alpha/FixB family protein [Uliginosibacterium sp. H3]
MSILVIAEHDNKQIKSTTLNALGAAAKIGGEIHVLVIGGNCADAAQAAGKIAGVAKVRVIDAAHYADHTAENIAIAAAQLGGSYSHVLLPASSFGKNLGPRLAALLDVAQVSDIVGVESADTFVRPIYAGSALATVQSADPVKVITVRVSAFDAVAAEGGSAVIETAPAGPDLGVTKLIGRELTVSARPALGSARAVVSGGRALGSFESFHSVLEPLADKLGAAIGASRAAVDAGFAPNESQVGQTGQVVAPDLYIAIGISGAIQHLAGMKESKVIVAINKDPDAAIFGVADYGIVGDLFELVPQLTASL